MLIGYHRDILWDKIYEFLTYLAYRDCVTSLELPESNIIEKPLVCVHVHVAPDIIF
jgi:hypothetical protein